MAIIWTKLIPRWGGDTIEPPEDKKDTGYFAGDKPPAKWENWLRKGTYEALDETRDVIEDIDSQLAQIESEIDSTVKKDVNNMVDIVTNPVGTGVGQVYRALGLKPTFNPTANERTIATQLIEGTVNRHTSGHTIVTNMYITPPKILGIGEVITDAASLYIQGMPDATNIDTKLSLFINSGNSRIRDKLAVGHVTLPLDTLHVGTLSGSTHIMMERLAGDGSQGKMILGADVNGFIIYNDAYQKVLSISPQGVMTYKSGTTHGECVGSPEGVVTAPIGSTRVRTNGGANTTFYVKQSGTGNTGWVAK